VARGTRRESRGCSSNLQLRQSVCANRVSALQIVSVVHMHPKKKAPPKGHTVVFCAHRSVAAIPCPGTATVATRRGSGEANAHASAPRPTRLDSRTGPASLDLVVVRLAHNHNGVPCRPVQLQHPWPPMPSFHFKRGIPSVSILDCLSSKSITTVASKTRHVKNAEAAAAGAGPLLTGARRHSFNTTEARLECSSTPY
jgi:hypothetical protein